MMSRYYTICPSCGGTLDPGERCDCLDACVNDTVKKLREGFQHENIQPQKRQISETYVIGVDIGLGDFSAISIFRTEGSQMEHIQTMYGEEAEEYYKGLAEVRE